jgi:hypothetical protein
MQINDIPDETLAGIILAALHNSNDEAYIDVGGLFGATIIDGAFDIMDVAALIKANIMEMNGNQPTLSGELKIDAGLSRPSPPA